MLCDACGTPLRYRRWCDACRKEVRWDRVLRGLPVGGRRFIPLTRDELDAVKPEKSQFIELKQFVSRGRIDPVYYDRHYFAAPQAEKDKAYFLFYEALSLAGKAAVGTFVMHEKEHVCIVHAYKNGLLLTTLNYAYEIRDIAAVEEMKERPALAQEERSLAKKLIDQMTAGEFDIASFKDTFTEELKKVVRAKAEAIEAMPKARKKAAKSLIEALRASVK